MKSLRSWLRGEREKLSGMERREQAAYIWQYYKLWIIGIAALILIPLYVAIRILTTPGDNWFYAAFANTPVEVNEKSELWQNYVDYAGFDIHEKNVFFNNNCYFDPHDQGYNEYYTYFVAYVEAGTLDVITMERDDLEELGTKGRLLDLSRPEAAHLAEKYADRLIYATPIDETYSAQPVPIGIDLSDTCLVTKYHLYPDSCALGISMNCPHMEATELFLDFIIEEEGRS